MFVSVGGYEDDEVSWLLLFLKCEIFQPFLQMLYVFQEELKGYCGEGGNSIHLLLDPM